MQQRRPRLGDILDDYCPRERRITNHAVVAMIEDQVKQTRCTTCDADHEYKAARVPPPRRKRGDAIGGEPAEGVLRPRAAAEEADPIEETGASDAVSDDPVHDSDAEPQSPVEHVNADADADGDALPMAAAGPEEDGPVHRRLIRATLPRPEGQTPERKEPDFTIRQPGGRGGRGDFDGNKAGSRFGHGRRPMRTQGGGGGGGSQQRFGGPRPGPGGQRNGSGQGRPGGGNRPGHPGGPRGNRPGQGAGRGGGGRKRGR